MHATDGFARFLCCLACCGWGRPRSNSSTSRLYVGCYLMTGSRLKVFPFPVTVCKDVDAVVSFVADGGDSGREFFLRLSAILLTVSVLARAGTYTKSHHHQRRGPESMPFLNEDIIISRTRRVEMSRCARRRGWRGRMASAGVGAVSKVFTPPAPCAQGRVGAGDPFFSTACPARVGSITRRTTARTRTTGVSGAGLRRRGDDVVHLQSKDCMTPTRTVGRSIRPCSRGRTIR